MEEKRFEAEETLEDSRDARQTIVVEIDFGEVTVFGERRYASQKIVV